MSVSLTPVTSSNIRAAGYDAANQVLVVQFASGGIYEYSDVPQDVYDAFALCASKGQYLAQHIKPRFESRKVEENKPDDYSL